MIDLQINNAGDLVTSQHNPLCSLKLIWKVTDNPTIKLSFMTGPSNSYENSSDNIAPPLMFYIDTDRKSDSKSPDSCGSEEELKQRILLLTRAAARIVRVKHKDITSEAVLNEIQDAVLEQVSSVLEDPSVIVRKEQMYGHVFSWQNVNVYIYDGNKEIYNFQLEV
jgi:hypothetical protein